MAKTNFKKSSGRDYPLSPTPTISENNRKEINDTISEINAKRKSSEKDYVENKRKSQLNSANEYSQYISKQNKKSDFDKYYNSNI